MFPNRNTSCILRYFNLYYDNIFNISNVYFAMLQAIKTILFFIKIDDTFHYNIEFSSYVQCYAQIEKLYYILYCNDIGIAN